MNNNDIGNEMNNNDIGNEMIINHEMNKKQPNNDNVNVNQMNNNQINNNDNDNNNINDIKRKLEKKAKKRENRKILKQNRHEPLKGNSMNATDFIINNNTIPILRNVIPYPFEYSANTKQRWIGRPLYDIFSDEFDANPVEYYARAFLFGHIKINGELVPSSYLMKSGDYMTHLTHRHEPPVLYVSGKDMVIAETDNLVIVNKPASIPVHPSGAYRFNSVTYILGIEMNLKGLCPVYRLDRLTSGILVLAKSGKVAADLAEMVGRKKNKGLLRKFYVARIKGKFPSNNIEFIVSSQFHQALESYTNPTNKIVETKELSWDGGASANEYVDSIGVPPPGYIWEQDNILSISYPLGALSLKTGSQQCVVDGKPALSKFYFIDYDIKTNTSLICCEPVTGRTHQLRLHLQLIGYPIANDPNYGNMKFENGYMIDSEESDEKIKNENFVERIKSSTFIRKPFEEFVLDDSDKSWNNLSTEELLIKNCQYCSRGGESATFNQNQLRHEGIWLHAYRYVSKPSILFDDINNQNEEEKEMNFDWTAPVPIWANMFKLEKLNHII